MPASNNRRLGLWLAVTGLGLGAAGSCFAQPEGVFQKPTDDDGGPSIVIDGSSGDAKGELPPTDPHAVLGVDPPHGPWNGGQTVMVRGNGFDSKARVWFAGNEIPSSDLVPVDAERVQVVVPPGAAGPVDVTVQNGTDASTKRTLLGGYEYDAFYAEPKSGPTSGGTLVKLYGQGTHWNSQVKVLVDLLPCTDVTVTSDTELECKTPKSTPGTKPIRVTTEDAVSVDVLDAFTYGDSDNGYKGGLSGNPLKDQLKVIVLDGYEGTVLPGATAIAGDDLDQAGAGASTTNGIVQRRRRGRRDDRARPLQAPRRRSRSRRSASSPPPSCRFSVDTVTVYLDPILSPACAPKKATPPPVGRLPHSRRRGDRGDRFPSEVRVQEGALVQDPGSGLAGRAASWPTCSTASSEHDDLRLHAAEPLRRGHHRGRPGEIGYQLAFFTSQIGNLTLYALAGIENRVNRRPPSRPTPWAWPRACRRRPAR